MVLEQDDAGFSEDSFDAEKKYLENAYVLLQLHKQNIQKLNDPYDEVTRGGTHQARFERDATIYQTANWLSKFNIGDRPLCFGRIDKEIVNSQKVTKDNLSTTYIGRVSVHDENLTPIVVDWRAPVASAYYQATIFDNKSVIRRRNFIVEKQELIRINDDLLAPEKDTSQLEVNLLGEAALITALNKKRTGRMNDIVSTIQSEQDEIIRSDFDKTILISGGPGTGKTVVVLHRIAFLLYTYREQLKQTGALIIGPSSVFLRYIEEVLPSLGEDEESVRLTTINHLRSDLEVSEGKGENLDLKGRPEWIQIIQNAVEDRYRPLFKDKELWIDGIKFVIPKLKTQLWVEQAKTRKGKYNSKRKYIVNKVLQYLTKQYLQKVASGIVQSNSSERIKDVNHPPKVWVEEFYRNLRQKVEIRWVLESIWPILSGPELIYDLFSTPKLLENSLRNISNPSLVNEILKTVLVPRNFSIFEVNKIVWERGDVALIDEADSILGDKIDSLPESVKKRKYNHFSKDVSSVIDSYGIKGYMSEDFLAERFQDQSGLNNIESDEGFFLKTYGYLVVDEAQDLSSMEWRMCSRRCPTKRATIVGDINQRSILSTSDNLSEFSLSRRTWNNIFDNFPSPKFDHKRLTKNYRTPKPLVDFAVRVSQPLVESELSESIREEGIEPLIANQPLMKVLEGVIEDRSVGTVTLVVPFSFHENMSQEINEFFKINSNQDSICGYGKNAIDNKIAILDASETKGLEFDTVVLYKPEMLISPSDRYVVCTRATKSLIIVEEENINAWWRQ